MVGFRCFAAAVLGLGFLAAGVLLVTQEPAGYRWSGEAAIAAGVACLAVMVLGLRERAATIPAQRTKELPEAD